MQRTRVPAIWSNRAPRGPLLAFSAAVALAAMGTGCSRVAVEATADPRANFSTYTSFAFLPNGGMTGAARDVPRRLRATLDPLYHAYVQEAVTRDLTAKGLVLATDREAADLLIGYRTVVGDRADVYPAIYGVGWRGHVHVARPPQVRWYKEGTLVIELIDRRGEYLVWRGIGVGAMRDMRPGEDLMAAVGDIMAEFPPAE